jgi:hypothetical protein
MAHRPPICHDCFSDLPLSALVFEGHRATVFALLCNMGIQELRDISVSSLAI